MTADEAIRDLLDISTDVTGVAVLGADGELLASGPGAVASDARRPPRPALWGAAGARPSRRAPAGSTTWWSRTPPARSPWWRPGRRIVAVTGPQPAVGLLLFDLRTCLGDAFPGEEAS